MTNGLLGARSQINQVLQLGTETVGAPGGGSGHANNRLGTFNSQIAPVASGAFGLFRPSGGKYVGQIVPTDIYAEGPFTDTIDFNTVTFMYAGNVGKPTPITDPAALGVTNGSGSFKYHFAPVPYGPLNVLSYVVEEGQIAQGAVPAAKYNYNNVIIPDFNMRFMRTGASQSGGRLLGKVLPPTGDDFYAATTRQGRAINGIKTGVWAANTWADLVGAETYPYRGTGSTTRLDPVALDIAFRHNGIFVPWFALDDSITSFAGTLEQAADAGVQITVLADVDSTLQDIAGRFNYKSMNDGSRIFLKVLNVGPIIGGIIPYSHELNMSLQISGPPRRSTVGALRVWQFDCLLTPNETTPFLPFDATVVNTLDPAAFAVV